MPRGAVRKYDHDEIVALRLEGFSVAEIAGIVGCCTHTVKRVGTAIPREKREELRRANLSRQILARFGREVAFHPSTGTRVCKCGKPKSLQAEFCRECYLEEMQSRPIPHGTETGYKRCHCPACRAAAVAARNRRRWAA